MHGLRRALTALLVAAAVASLWLAIALVLRVRVLDDVRDLSLHKVQDADRRATGALRLLLLVALPVAALTMAWVLRIPGRVHAVATRTRGLFIAWGITFGLGVLTLMGSARSRPRYADVRVGPALDRFIRADRSAAVGALLLATAAILAVLVVRPRRSGPAPRDS